MAEAVGILKTPVTSRKTWQVTFNTSSLGLTDVVDPSKLKMKFDPITTGTTGKKNKLGDRFVGFDGMITVQLRQLDAGMYAILCTWAAEAPYPLTPPLNADMFSYSCALVLHPFENGADTTEDLQFSNAVCMELPGTPKRDGNGDDVWEVNFAVYPSRTGMNTSAGAITPGTLKGS